jgi:hypothetical protein
MLNDEARMTNVEEAFHFFDIRHSSFHAYLLRPGADAPVHLSTYSAVAGFISERGRKDR